jgi:hypothetical protein
MHEQKVNDAHELAYIQHISGGCYEAAAYLRGQDGEFFKVGPFRGGVKRTRLYYEYFISLMGHAEFIFTGDEIRNKRRPNPLRAAEHREIANA